jgi:hypothetical protein
MQLRKDVNSETVAALLNTTIFISIHLDFKTSNVTPYNLAELHYSLRETCWKHYQDIWL